MRRVMNVKEVEGKVWYGLVWLNHYFPGRGGGDGQLGWIEIKANSVQFEKKVKKAGMDIKLYERFIDDSNQVAVTPPPGAKSDAVREKVVIDPELVDSDEHLDMRQEWYTRF